MAAFTRYGKTRRKNRALTTLNMVWELAIYLAMLGFSPPIIRSGGPKPKKELVSHTISFTNNGKNMMILITPITLKRVCALAVRCALIFAPTLANSAVMVVPMLSPRINATLASKVNRPCMARAMVIPTVALEL